MLKLEPVEINLNDAHSVELIPGEDAILVLEFNRDMTGTSHNIFLDEFKWPHSPAPGYTLLQLQRDTFDMAEAVEGIIKHSISKEDVEALSERVLFIKWQVSENARTWIAASKEVYVGNRS